MSRVYILGAGASAFAGYPSARGLWSFVKQHASIDGDLQTIIRELAERYQADHADDPDLESLFTLLDVQLLLTLRAWQGNTDWILHRVRFIAALVKAFLDYQRLFQRFFWNDRTNVLPLNQSVVARVYRDWQGRLSLDDTIISFNWDILHESLLYRTDKWHPFSGYGFRVQDLIDPERPSMLLLKLHGSANWQQHEKTDRIHLTTPHDFFPQLRTTFLRKNLSPAERRLDESLIIPTYLKKISDNPILVKLWALAAAKLRLADEFIAIGFSLNPADQAASSLISEAILNSQKMPKLTVINCNRGNWKSFCERLGVQPDYAQMRFEEWLSSGQLKNSTSGLAPR